MITYKYVISDKQGLHATNAMSLCRAISSADFMPCAFKCLVTLTPQEHTERFKQQLLITKKELQKWQKLNMLIVDNRGL